MNNRIAGKIIGAHGVTEDYIGTSKWNHAQYAEAHRRSGMALLDRFGVVGVPARTESGLAILGGRFLKTMDEKFVYFLDEEQRRAVLPIVKTARQERAVVDMVSKLMTGVNFCVDATYATTTKTTFPYATLQWSAINDAEAFLRTCERTWKTFPIVLAVDFAADGNRMRYTSVHFPRTEKALATLAKWHAEDPFHRPLGKAIGEAWSAPRLRLWGKLSASRCGIEIRQQ